MPGATAMMLTPVTLSELPDLLARFDRNLAADPSPLVPMARRVLDRIGATMRHAADEALTLSQDRHHQEQAVALVESFGMGVLWEPPTGGYTWDGSLLRVEMEPSVIVHDVAHLQVCAPERRTAPDFGLGAGPETGLRREADAAMTVFGVEREMEEALASLLGILWEVELDQPAICAFAEQNWLEGVDTPQARSHYLKILGHLHRFGLVDNSGRPTRALREEDDHTFLSPLVIPMAA